MKRTFYKLLFWLLVVTVIWWTSFAYFASKSPDYPPAAAAMFATVETAFLVALAGVYCLGLWLLEKGDG